MLRERPRSPRATPQQTYYLVYAAVAGFMALGSIALVWWIVYNLRAQEPVPPTNPVYTNYDIGGDYTATPEWAAAQTQVAEYIQQNPQPQNVHVLTGWTTAQIYGYMVNQVSGGLKVGCNYCHTFQNGQYNFASYTNVNKVKAAGMMRMSADLNKNWISLLPASVGNRQVTCATCHNGQPAGWSNYPAEVTDLVPRDFRLPLDNQYPGVLTVTGNTEKSLDDVAINQYAMYHMNASLGQGCTFCHNARYFPSYEVAQKQYAVHMLNMSRHLNGIGTVDLADLQANAGVDVIKTLNIAGVTSPQFTYLSLMNNKSPSCWMCHRGANLPPGSANEGQVPPQLSQ
jgi:photosynthetic reaction center cytochrome c subunit